MSEEVKKAPNFSPLECTICCNDFDDKIADLTPRILTACGHTICEKCASKLLKESKIVCPYDRKVTSLSSKNITSLLKNESLIAVIQQHKAENAKAQQKSDAIEKENSTNNENACIENSKHEAALYCKQCEAEFCESCFLEVHKSKIMSVHSKLPLKDKPFKLPKCTKHPNNTAGFFCKDPNCKMDEKKMCHSCLLTGEHKSHEYELLVDQVSMDVKKLKNMSDRLKDSVKKHNTYLEKFEACIKTFDDTNPSYLNLVNNITEQFENKKVEALKNLKKFVFDSRARLRAGRNEARKNLYASLKNLARIMDRLEIKHDLCNDVNIVPIGKPPLHFLYLQNGNIRKKFDEYDYSLTEKMILEIKEK
ncbi:hypothetical protein GCK72_003670 [Caenorhabditis remanei]|uniref:RING-type domain-containing protein n=1 Tax=Caenorhabditis remanei TaxID=31234 RepID=A0A6A5H972_CAERE|nr:hypothetical protein GCK72_003670 [Caenorhabditis remanei]KAF1763725.1 hypothetical protein GCK72_003670 [Caenorhabditis remanei]